MAGKRKPQTVGKGKKKRTIRQKVSEELGGHFLEFTPLQFQLLDKSADLYEKKAASTSVILEELGIPGLFLASRRALISAGMLAIKNRDESEVMGPSLLTVRQREALRWAVIYYRGELFKLIKKEGGLLIETDDTEYKIEQADAILGLLGEQLELGAPVELMATTKGDDTTVSINGGEQISIHDIDRVTQELRAALEKDLEDAEKEGD